MAVQGDVVVKMTAADAELIRAWDRAKKGPREMAQELEKVKSKSHTATSDMAAGWANIAKGFTAAALAVKAFDFAMSGVQKGLAAFAKDYEQFLGTRQSAADFQLTVVAAQREALRNLGTGADITPKQMAAMIDKIAADTGIDLVVANRAAAGAMGSRGRFKASEAIEQMGVVAKLDPSLVMEEMQAAAVAAMQIRETYRGTPAQAAGSLLSAAQASPVISIGEYGENVVGILKGMAAYGDDFKSAVAITSAVAQASADKHGRISATGSLHFAEQLALHSAAIKNSGKSTGERIAFLISGEKDAEKLRQKLIGVVDEMAKKEGYTKKGVLTAETKPLMALRALITPGSDVQKLYQDILKRTPTIAEGEEYYKEQIKGQHDLGIQATGRLAEAARGSKQKILSIPELGMTGIVRQSVKEQLDLMGGVWGAQFFQNWLEMKEYDIETMMGVMPQKAGADILTRRLRNRIPALLGPAMIPLAPGLLPGMFMPETGERAEATQALIEKFNISKKEQLEKEKAGEAWPPPPRPGQAASPTYTLPGEVRPTGALPNDSNKTSSSRVEELLEQIVANTGSPTTIANPEAPQRSARRAAPLRPPLAGITG